MELTIPIPGHEYPVYVERGALDRAGARLDLDRRVLILTDEGVPADYARRLAAQCREARVCTVPQGEGSKSLEGFGRVLGAMLDFGMTRHDCLAAVGGGVVGDLGGFAAASYMRGIDFYNLPTTVLSMVDSSVGGKTAVNFGGVKNIVGAFHQPRAVVIDPELLETLPPRHVANGLAEAVKMALSWDEAAFAAFEDPAGPGPMEALVARALGIKAAVVAADEREQGLRRLLNLGHTLGHGIEAACGGALLHGECVALGMLPMCAPEVRGRLAPVLSRLGLPLQADFDPEAALGAIAHDKKGGAGGVTVVTVPQVGRYAFQTMELAELGALLEPLRK